MVGLASQPSSATTMGSSRPDTSAVQSSPKATVASAGQVMEVITGAVTSTTVSICVQVA